jgi:hypothetical protein
MGDRRGRDDPPESHPQRRRCPVKKLVFAILAALCLTFVSVGPARAGSPVSVGTVYHPGYGYVRYVYNHATGYVYFPQLGRGTYLRSGSAGAVRPSVGRIRPLSTRDYAGGSVIGGPGGAVGFLSTGSGTSVSFGPGGPIYSSSR